MEKKCLICAEEFNDSIKERNKIINKECNHYYCFTCWFHYIQDKIENGNVSKINFPNYECKQNLTENFIIEIIKDIKILFKNIINLN